VGGLEAERVVEAVGVGAELVGRQLHYAATPLRRLLDDPLEENPPDALAAIVRSDTHALNLGSFAAHMRKSGNEGKLQGSHDASGVLDDDQVVALVSRDVVERLRVILRQGFLNMGRLALSPELVVGQQADDVEQVIAPGRANHEVVHGILLHE
jgi:hypothetical protein